MTEQSGMYHGLQRSEIPGRSRDGWEPPRTLTTEEVTRLLFDKDNNKQGGPSAQDPSTRE